MQKGFFSAAVFWIQAPNHTRKWRKPLREVVKKAGGEDVFLTKHFWLLWMWIFNPNAGGGLKMANCKESSLSGSNIDGGMVLCRVSWGGRKQTLREVVKKAGGVSALLSSGLSQFKWMSFRPIKCESQTSLANERECSLQHRTDILIWATLKGKRVKIPTYFWDLERLTCLTTFQGRFQ